MNNEALYVLKQSVIHAIDTLAQIGTTDPETDQKLVQVMRHIFKAQQVLQTIPYDQSEEQ